MRVIKSFSLVVLAGIVAVGLTVSSARAAILTADPPIVDFGEVEVGNSSTLTTNLLLFLEPGEFGNALDPGLFDTDGDGEIPFTFVGPDFFGPTRRLRSRS